jgi:hypothetical protein
MKFIAAFLLTLIVVKGLSQDHILKVHFLYGSKPAKQFKDSERKWFGGKLGGHVGIESDSGKIISFFRKGKFHWFGSKKNRHSRYAIHSPEKFYNIFGTTDNEVKSAIVYIPVSLQQKQKFDSLTTSYLNQTPYDYAFLGMRCGAAAYEILAQLEILPRYSISKTARKIFYPKKLRRRLFTKADALHWRVDRQDGSLRRKWERH